MMPLEPVKSLVIEGCASLFGVEDLAGDVLRASAFARSLNPDGRGIGMLLQHAHGRTAGRWTMVREVGRGLFVRRLVSTGTPAGNAALVLIGECFRPRLVAAERAGEAPSKRSN